MQSTVQESSFSSTVAHKEPSLISIRLSLVRAFSVSLHSESSTTEESTSLNFASCGSFEASLRLIKNFNYYKLNRTFVIKNGSREALVIFEGILATAGQAEQFLV